METIEDLKSLVYSYDMELIALKEAVQIAVRRMNPEEEEGIMELIDEIRDELLEEMAQE